MTRETGRPQHIAALTGLRAYAAIWVVLLHLQHGIGVSGLVTLGPVVNHGFWAVDIFFVLSGFILSLLYAPGFAAAFEWRAFRKYVGARFARIYPLHLVALLPLCAYYLGRAVLDGARLPPGFSIDHLLLNVSLLHGWGFAERLSWNYPSWSISTEWFAYLVMLPVLARGLRKASPGTALGMALAAWTVVYALVHGKGEMVGSQNVHWGLPRIAAEFALGYGLYRLTLRWQPAARAADLLVVGSLGLIVALCLAPSWTEWFVAPVVGGLVFGLVRAGPIGSALFGNRAAVFWGERSYSIYMLHAVVQIAFNLALHHMGLRVLEPAQAWLMFIGQLVVVLVASHFAYGWVELPMRQRWRRRLAPQGATP